MMSCHTSASFAGAASASAAFSRITVMDAIFMASILIFSLTALVILRNFLVLLGLVLVVGLQVRESMNTPRKRKRA
jgi:hypothetical protein